MLQRSFFGPEGILRLSTQRQVHDERRVAPATVRRFLAASSLGPLRSFLAELADLPSARMLDDHEVLELVSRLLDTGKLHASLELWKPVRVVPLGEEKEEQSRPPGPKEDPKTWIEIQMVDMSGAPMPGVSYRIDGPDGSVYEGRLDAAGRARIIGLDPGMCKVTFPELDKDAWERA